MHSVTWTASRPGFLPSNQEVPEGSSPEIGWFVRMKLTQRFELLTRISTATLKHRPGGPSEPTNIKQFDVPEEFFGAQPDGLDPVARKDRVWPVTFLSFSIPCKPNSTLSVIFESSKFKARMSLLPHFSDKRVSSSSFELPEWDRL